MRSITHMISAIGWRAVYAAENGLISRPVVAWCMATDDQEGDETGYDYDVFGQTCNKKNVEYEHAVNFLGYMHESEDINMYWEDYIEYVAKRVEKV